jgi:two-component sensor histidine kinase
MTKAMVPIILLLDIKTLIAALVLGLLLAATLLILDTYKGASPFDRLFLLGLVFQALAWLLIDRRGSIPDLLSFSIGNSLQFCGMALQGIGLLSLKRRISRAWIAVYSLALALMLAFWWFPGISTALRIFLISLPYPVFFGVPGWFLLGIKAKAPALQRFIGSMLILYSIFMVVRGVFVLGQGDYSLASRNFVQILGLLILILVMILVSIGYILVRKEQANAQLTIVTEEKNLLLVELQHRVKNSLAIISSLTSLEMSRQTEPAFVESMGRVRNRIDAVSRLYDLLLDADPTRGVRLDVYIRDLTERLYEGYSPGPDKICLAFDLEETEANAKTSISVGIIVNELATNAMKYAFPADRKGSLRISLAKREGKIALEVADDGIGMPEGRAEGLGSLIVSMLVRQIDGEMSRSGRPGTSVKISF